MATHYASDATLGRDDVDIITPQQAGTLYGLFRERASRSGDATAYQQFEAGCWRKYSWADMSVLIERWRAGFNAAGLAAGDRVAILQRNSIEWVCFDMAAHAQGLVVVPLYMDDRADNMAYILELTQSSLLFIDSAGHWEQLRAEKSIDLEFIRQIVSAKEFDACTDTRVVALDDWLPASAGGLDAAADNPQALASIIFTSGTTGKPKGVMLSHANMLVNAYSCVRYGPFLPTDSFISFLPLSHTFERTVGYYMTIMAGAQVAYARSIPDLADDLLHHKPTVIVTVPRIFERIQHKVMASLEQGPKLKKFLFYKAMEIGWQRFEYVQGRAAWHPALLLWPLLDRLVAEKLRDKLGGRMRCAISGGAPLSEVVAKMFISLGFNIIQGYGMTEASPVLSSNLIGQNKPASVGLPLLDVEVMLGEDNEILARGPNIMLGYWQNEAATRETMTQDGWLKTGDCGRIDEDGFIYIVGRIKDILVLSNGEKLPPADIEAAIEQDLLFEQSMVIGEGKPYLGALVVLNRDLWSREAAQLGLDGSDEAVLDNPDAQAFLTARIAEQMYPFPGYAKIYKTKAMFTPWTVESGFLTPTLKLKRPVLKQQFAAEIDDLYEGH